MALYRPRAYQELRGDLLGPLSLGRKSQDVEFPLRQSAPRTAAGVPIQRFSSYGRMEYDIATGDRDDGGDHLLTPCGLEQVAACTGRQRSRDVVGVVIGAEDQDMRRTRLVSNLPCDFDPVEDGQAHVQQQHVWPEVERQHHRGGPIYGLPDDGDGLVLVEHLARAFSDDGVIVDYHDSDRLDIHPRPSMLRVTNLHPLDPRLA